MDFALDHADYGPAFRALIAQRVRGWRQKTWGAAGVGMAEGRRSGGHHLHYPALGENARLGLKTEYKIPSWMRFALSGVCLWKGLQTLTQGYVRK